MLQRVLSLLDWIYKKRCYFCKRSSESVRMCTECYDKLTTLPVGINRIINGVNILCAGNYSKDLQKLIRGLKYHKQRDLAFYRLTRCGSLSAPFGTLHQNRPHIGQFFRQKRVRDSLFIFLHSEGIIAKICRVCQSLGNLAAFR